MIRLRPKLSFANVAAALALFVALGGGYAVAFSGSGTLQKGHKSDISEGSVFDVVRTLNGIGSLQATCEDNMFTQVRIHNSSGETLRIRSYEYSNGDFDALEAETTIADGGNEDQFVQDESSELLRFFIYPAGNGKAPQAHVTVRVSGGHPTQFCDFASLRVLALNTEE